jgi:hypothetical protein
MARPIPPGDHARLTDLAGALTDLVTAGLSCRLTAGQVRIRATHTHSYSERLRRIVDRANVACYGAGNRTTATAEAPWPSLGRHRPAP